MMVVEVIVATRLNKNDFWKNSPLGSSLKRLMTERLAQSSPIKATVAFNNKRGLPDIYNMRINAPDSGDYLIFVHDDIWLEDAFLYEHVCEGLSRYDIIGVAGNRRRVAGQPAWCFIDDHLTPDHSDHLSGRVGHLAHLGAISAYGEVPADCELLDGCFLAAKKSELIKKNVLFDPLFSFQFYDMDFCRTARQQQLRLGTWPISLSHQSTGAFDSTLWREKLTWYRAKWND